MKQVAVIGLGPGNPDLLCVGAAEKLKQADLIVGAQRLLDSLPPQWGKDRRAATRGPEIAGILETAPDWNRACVVMSGDVGLFSGAARLGPFLAPYRWEAIPGISSAQYFAAKLGRPWQDWQMASAHGTDCDLAALLRGGRPVFLVTDKRNTPAALCADLCQKGLGQTPVWVGQRLSYPDETIAEGTAETMMEREFDPLCVLLAQPGAPGSKWPYASAGMPDDLFIRGQVPMTKQEVRAVALAKLKVKQDDLLYDIGAGTGSVSVELAQLAQNGTVYAIEHNPGAVSLLEQNRQAFGAANLHIVQGSAPSVLDGLPAPDGVFIGGSGGNLAGILQAVARKNPSVRVCIACVTLETLSLALESMGAGGFQEPDICQVQAARGQKTGPYHLMNGQNPVFLISGQGRGSHT